MAYAGRLAIIAGGLGGLGTATAKLLRSQGAKLALLYAPFESARKDSILKSVYGTSTAPDITTYECDITSESNVESVFSSLPTDTQSAFPSILINAAGYVTVQPFEETSAEEALKNILPNLMGPFVVSRAFYHLYVKHARILAGEQQQEGGKGTVVTENPNDDLNVKLGDKQQQQGQVTMMMPPPGRIVSISSQAAHKALWGHGPYCASKAGLNGLTRCMANEWGPKGITANTVSPTVVLTQLGARAWSDPVKRKEMESQIPTGRFAVPEEIAEAVEWLCRDGSGMVNGADIRVDGGFTIK